jgi:hypothetical protein
MNQKSAYRKAWRKAWLGSIQEIADLDKQQRMWLDVTNTNPHYSPIEYLACYFDDLGLSNRKYIWAVGEGLLTHSESEAVAEFHSCLDAFTHPDLYDHAAVLDDPEWLEVVSAARSAQSALLNLIDDPAERRTLTES